MTGAVKRNQRDSQTCVFGAIVFLPRAFLLVVCDDEEDVVEKRDERSWKAWRRLADVGRL